MNKIVNVFSFRTYFLKENEPVFFNENDKKIIQKFVSFNKEFEALKFFVKNINHLSTKTYWYVLGVIWISNDVCNINNIFHYLFTEIKKKNSKYCMTDFEKDFLKKLPKKILAYRVHHEEEGKWMSLSLDISVANRFCDRYKTENITVYEISKKNVFAYFNRRDEKELLILDNTKAKKIKVIKKRDIF